MELSSSEKRVNSLKSKQNVITIGIRELIAQGNISAIRFAMYAPAFMGPQEPSMVIGKPGIVKSYLEDGGRTYVMPVGPECPKLYACQNETGGVTVMLADEY